MNAPLTDFERALNIGVPLLRKHSPEELAHIGKLLFCEAADRLGKLHLLGKVLKLLDEMLGDEK